MSRTDGLPSATDAPLQRGELAKSAKLRHPAGWEVAHDWHGLWCQAIGYWRSWSRIGALGLLARRGGRRGAPAGRAVVGVVRATEIRVAPEIGGQLAAKV